MDLQPLTSLLSHPELSDRAKVMLVVLSQQPNTSAAHLAQACGHRLRKAQLALRELIQQGLVEPHYHSRQVSYRLKDQCGQLSAECGKSANDPAICEQSFADRTALRERSCADPPAANAPTRTLWSSSSEEDSFCTPLSVPSPPGGVQGGTPRLSTFPTWPRCRNPGTSSPQGCLTPRSSFTGCTAPSAWRSP